MNKKNYPPEFLKLLKSVKAKRPRTVMSWSCENCENWILKEVSNCQSCYWAFPESYSHVAMQEIRRLDVLWVGEEVTEYDQLKETAGKVGEETTTYVKNVLRNHLESEGD